MNISSLLSRDHPIELLSISSEYTQDYEEDLLSTDRHYPTYAHKYGSIQNPPAHYDTLYSGRESRQSIRPPKEINSISVVRHRHLPNINPVRISLNRKLKVAVKLPNLGQITIVNKRDPTSRNKVFKND